MSNSGVLASIEEYVERLQRREEGYTDEGLRGLLTVLQKTYKIVERSRKLLQTPKIVCSIKEILEDQA